MERHTRKRSSPNKPQWLNWLHKQNQTGTNELGLTKEMISREKRLKLIRQDLIQKIDPKGKAQMRWLEQWDIDSIYSENVDLANSQAALGIPLVDVAVGPGLHIALSMSYTSGDVSTNGVLGNGWNLHNAAQDFIVVDHKQSSFSQNHEYQLSIEGQLLKLLPSKDSDDQFTIENETDVKVTWLKAQNRWIIDTPNMRTVYGASENPTIVPDALQWSLHWPYWRGPGTNEATLEQEVISWYMVSREEKHALKRKLYYKYITQNKTIPSTGQTFTSVIQLESVFDSEKKYVLNLIYDSKDQQEYFVKVYKDKQGIIQFPIHLLKNLYLVGYHLETDGYQQQLQFDYEVEANGTRKLTGISQIFNENGGKMGEIETIFNFNYQSFPGSKYLLSEVEIPTYHSSLHYSYENLEIPLLRFENESLNTKRIPVVGNVQINQGEDFATLSYDLGNGGIYVEVYNKPFTLFIAQMSTKTGRRPLDFDEGEEEEDPKKIKRFATLLFRNLVAVLEETGEEKRLNLFHRDSETNEWPRSPTRTIRMAKDSVFRYTDKLMVISRNEVGSLGKLLVIQPNSDDDENDPGYKEFELVLSNGGNYRVDRLVVQDNVILAYNGQRLHGWKEDSKEDGKWLETVIYEKHSMEEEFFEMFEANKEFIGGIREQMNLNGLHMSDNMILLTALDWNRNTEDIRTNAHLILVNDQLEKVIESVKQVGIEKVGEMEKEEEPFPGTNMTFRYEWNGGRNKFRVKLHDLRGEALEEMCKDQDDKEKCKGDVIKVYNEDENFRDQIKEMMLFDFERYFTFQLEPSGATTGNKKYEMTGGNGWEEKDIDGKGVIKLGTGFILETVENKTEGETMYALYRQNVEDGGIKGGKLGEWKLHNQLSGMSVGYPSYVAMQPDVMYEPELVVLREEGGQEIEIIKLGEQGEQILRMSNHETLFTLVNSTDPVFPSHDKKLIVRRVNGVVASSPMWALVETEVRYGGRESRVRGYENQFNCRDDMVAQENVVRVIPQNDKGYSGYYEEITVVPIEAPENSTKSQNWYDVNGELVLRKDVEQALEQEDDGGEEGEGGNWMKILDLSGHLEISDISPYNRSSEEVGYFGFESYENNTLPFEYQESSVTLDDVSLTGTRMLRVKNGESLKGSLTPSNQQQTYVASTWLRFPSGNGPEYEFDSPLECFKAYLTTHTGHQFMGVYAQMKRQQRDWIFAEISLDLDKIRGNVYSEFYRYSEQGISLPPPSTTNFTISLELSSENIKEDFWMDVDHIRFAPINLDWTVTVYDPRTGLETEQILGGGGILRKIYNKFSTEIGTVDETGQVEQFKSLSRSGFIFPPPTSDSQLGIQEYRREVVVIPEQGYYETFDEYSLQNIWTLEGQTETGSFLTTKGRLSHLVDATHDLILNKVESLFDSASSAIRLHVQFSSVQASLAISLNGLENFIRFEGNGALNISSGCKIIQNLPSSGELFFHISQDAVWLWFDGVLLLDRKLDRSCVGGPVSMLPWQTFKMEVKGKQTISDIIAIQNPEISLEFFNAWGERTQVVQLETSDSALVSETIYDEMGRDAIKTKATRITRSENYSPLLIYYTDFVKNRYPTEASSVFKTGTLQGLASTLNPEDEGFPYSRTLYQDDMLREISVEGMPGKTFSTFGTFTKKHGRRSGIPFLQILFPFDRNFREKVTHEPNGTLRVSVLDKNQNEVAIYVKVSGYDNILTIFEYDDKGKLLKMLPPKYHDHMRTYLRTKPWEFGEEYLTDEEIYWQGIYGTHYQYDENDQIVMKMGPDHKTKGFLYDTMGNIRFMYTLSNVTNFNVTLDAVQDDNQVAQDIVYMLHVGQNKPIEIGYFNDPINVGTLKSFQNGTEIPSVGNSQLHQRIVYSESHADPDIRGKVRLFLTYDSADVERASAGKKDGSTAPPHQELLRFGSSNQVVMKTSNAVHTDTFTNYQKHYKGNKLKEMAYPRGRYSRSLAANETVFNLIHSYDKIGRLEGLGIRTDPTNFAKIGYNPAGQVDQEILEPGTFSNSSRRFEYNSPGLLTRIVDPYLSQSMSFIDGGYGQGGMGDGILMNNVMNSTWSSGISQLNEIQKKWFSISEEGFEEDKELKKCLQALRRVGILDEDTNIPLKFLTKSLLSLLPLSCSGDMGLRLMNLIARHLPPTSNYGHSYSYGNHQELTKSKFFGDGEKESTLGPLRFVTFFEEIPEVGSLEEAEVIWDLLTRNQYLLVDNGNSEDKAAAIGKQGTKGLFRFSILAQDLKEVGEEFDVFSEPIMKMLYQNILEGVEIELGDFQNTFVNWHGYYDTPTANLIINRARESAEKIFNMLADKGWMSRDLERLLSQDYLEVMKNHGNVVAKVTTCLMSHFSAQMGTNIYDFESYYIDPNGNRQMFYQGLNRYELEYEGATNQVKRLTIREDGGDKVTDFEHDNQGNVIKAGHKNIQHIRYHPVTNRPVLIVLEDGRRILLKYDAQGERLLKRVFAPEGSNRLLSETKYLRDENGRVLMDKLTRFGENGEIVEEFESTYLYGPREMILGFYRNGKYYNVFTDHAGSTRLITHMGEVVAGYDYWPYGEVIRVFGEKGAHLMYRFTGQEYDEETGLYNYHARLYDPTIGRFFQPDPKSQYYSPYVYGGNSPVSLVDPDGEFFLMLFFAVVGAIVGGYLAGAAANGSFNPLKWNWKSGNTWLAILGGAVGGAMLPGSMAAAVGAIGLPATLLVGLGGSYLQMVKANGSWNPGDWDWSSPATYNAFLEGFGSAVQMVPGTKEALLNTKKYLKSMSKTGQKLFLEVASGASVALIKGAFENDGNFKFWEWDWSDPATWSSVKDGFMMGKGLPEKAGKAYRGFADMSKSSGWKSTLKNMKGTTKSFLKNVFKNKKHPLWKTLGKAVISYVATGMDQGSLDFTKWDWHGQSTYEGLLNNYKIASDLKDMADQWRQGEWKDAFKEFFQKEVKQRLVAALPQLGKIFDDMDKLGEFYEKYYVPEGDKGRFLEEIMGNPIVRKMLMELNDELAILEDGEEEDGGNFEKEMRDILGGLRAGSTIYPMVSEAIGNLIDCQSGKGEFEKCVIGGSSQGLVKRMNREFSRNVFKPSRLYQSKNEFVKVGFREKMEEYSEEILGIFGGVSGETRDEWFYGSFFVGSIFHSLLNVQNSNRKKVGVSPPQLYFLQEHIVDIENIIVTHVAMVVEKETRKILHVRSVFSLTAETFSGLKDKLVDYQKQMRFECYLSDNMTVDEVQAESIVISAKDFGGSDVYVITPDYHVDPCEGQGNGKQFIEIPQPTGETIYENFSKYLDESVETLEEKKKLYETLLKTFFNVSNQAKLISPTISSIPFIYGILHSNVKQTYEMSLSLDRFSNGILFVPKRNSKGQQTYHGIPSIISIKPGQNHSKFLHKSTALSLQKQALIGSLAQQTIETSSVSLPKFNRIFNQVGDNIDPVSIENYIRYIYYNNRIESSDVSIPSNHVNFHFISNFILGELISQIETSSFEIFVLAPAVPSSVDQQRLKAQRLFFLRNPKDGYCTILNIIESSLPTTESEYEFDPNVLTNIPSIPDVEISHLQMIQVNLNPNSVEGWSNEDVDSMKHPVKYFWQGINVTTEDHLFLTRDPNAYLKLETPSMQSTPAFSFSRDFITDMFSRLKENRLQLLINVDQDFQSVVMGILMGASTLVEPSIDGITTTLRNFNTDENHGLISEIPNPTKLSILSVAKEGVVIPQTEQILLANLKSIRDNEKEKEESQVEAKMKEATDELKMYQCSRDEELKEAFKVCSVPAVYDSSDLVQDPDGQRVYFEVDPETLSEVNCTAAENPFREYLRNHERPQTEGGLFGKIKTKFTQYVYGDQKTANDRNKPLDTQIEKCHLGAWTDGQYSMDGISCSCGKSKIAVFRNIEPNDLVRTSSRGDPFLLVGDTYRNEECTPISFNGRESVVCKGEKSSLIYTPYFEPRLFDELDGNLMLGRVILHLGGKMWSFVKVGNVAESSAEDHVVTEEMVWLWENDMREISTMLGKWEGDGKEMDWAKENLEDCRKMIESFEGNDFRVSAEFIEVITERLGALKEDLSEQILFEKAEKMFGENMEGWEKEFGDKISTENYGGAASTRISNGGVGMGYRHSEFGLGQGR